MNTVMLRAPLEVITATPRSEKGSEIESFCQLHSTVADTLWLCRKNGWPWIINWSERYLFLDNHLYDKLERRHLESTSAHTIPGAFPYMGGYSVDSAEYLVYQLVDGKLATLGKVQAENRYVRYILDATTVIFTLDQDQDKTVYVGEIVDGRIEAKSLLCLNSPHIEVLDSRYIVCTGPEKVSVFYGPRLVLRLPSTISRLPRKLGYPQVDTPPKVGYPQVDTPRQLGYPPVDTPAEHSFYSTTHPVPLPDFKLIAVSPSGTKFLGVSKSNLTEIFEIDSRGNITWLELPGLKLSAAYLDEEEILFRDTQGIHIVRKNRLEERQFLFRIGTRAVYPADEYPLIVLPPTSNQRTALQHQVKDKVPLPTVLKEIVARYII